MKQVFLKEFTGFFGSLIAYLVMSVFLVIVGLFTWVFPEQSVLNYGYADLGTFFSVAPYVFIFLISALSMRMFAEERKMGTLELLLTRPVSVVQIVLGKYAAVFALSLLTLLPTVLYYITLYQLGNPKGNLDTSGIVGSYVGLAFLAGLFCAVGLWASSLTANQIVAFLVAAFFCFLLYAGIDSLANLATAGAANLYIKQLGAAYHYEAMSLALIDSRDVTYFLTMAALFLFFTVLRIKHSV
jgi:ABC-2 type transport system permease protein